MQELMAKVKLLEHERMILHSSAQVYYYYFFEYFFFTGA